MAYTFVDLVYGEIFHYNDDIFRIHHILVLIVMPVGIMHKIGN